MDCQQQGSTTWLAAKNGPLYHQELLYLFGTTFQRVCVQMFHMYNIDIMTFLDLCVSVFLPVPERGLVGLDIYLSSVAEDITYYSSHPHVTYAFLITTEGKQMSHTRLLVVLIRKQHTGVAIMHPSYPRPASIWTQPKYVDIIHLEKVQNFSSVRTLILSKEEGHHLHKNANDRVHSKT